MPIYVPSRGPSDWRSLLADPQLHWRTGYSARSLAEAWEEASSIPDEVASLLTGLGRDPELLFAFPEHKVPLPGSSRGASQNDVFALVRIGGSTVAIMIEGKVEESFDKCVRDWLVNASQGKLARLAFLRETLGLDEDVDLGDVQYQLLHRTASALIEAERFKADFAAMIVHSFSPTDRWFDAYADFCALFGIEARVGELHLAQPRTKRQLYLGWAKGMVTLLD